jgi:hypothetical protein
MYSIMALTTFPLVKIQEVEAYLKHLQNGDQQRGKAAIITNLPSNDNQLHLAPHSPQHLQNGAVGRWLEHNLRI